MSDNPQRSETWIQERLGKVTASRIHDVTAKTKSGWGASRKTYMTELILERLTGQQAEQYTNAAMQWGIDKEADARAAYAAYVDTAVEEVGFIPHPHIPMVGASPDGRVGKDGLVEIKCPTSSTHLDTLLGEGIDTKYSAQMQFQMACTGRQWCDFVSYDPRMPGDMQFWTKRVHRNSVFIADLEKAAIEFLRELDDKMVALNRLYRGQPSDLRERLEESAKVAIVKDIIEAEGLT